MSDLDKQIAADPRHPAQAAVKENLELCDRVTELELAVEELALAIVQGFNSLAKVVELIRDNAEQPHTLAAEMRKLLEPPTEASEQAHDPDPVPFVPPGP